MFFLEHVSLCVLFLLNEQMTGFIWIFRRLFFFQKLGDCFLVRNQVPVLVSKNRRLLYRQTRKPFCSDPMKIHWCFFFISTDDMLEYGREGRTPDWGLSKCWISLHVVPDMACKLGLALNAWSSQHHGPATPATDMILKRCMQISWKASCRSTLHGNLWFFS